MGDKLASDSTLHQILMAALHHAPITASLLTVRNVSLKCENIYAVRFPIIFCSFIPSHLHWLLINVDLWCDLYNRSVCQSVKRTLGASGAVGTTGSLMLHFSCELKIGITWAPPGPL